MNKYKILTCTFLFSGIVVSVNSQSLTNLGYGTQIASGATLFLDNSNVGLTSGNAVVSIGYFSSLPGAFVATSSTFDSWVSLAETSTFSPLNGFVSTVSNNTDVAGAVGLVPYIAVFSGINDSVNYSSATGFSLVQSSTWSAITAGSGTPESPVTDSEYRTLSFDTIHLGSLQTGLGFSGGDGIATEVVPEPSAFAAIAGVLALGAVGARRRR